MKKTLKISLSLLSLLLVNVPATAAITGPYAGVGGGYGILRTPDSHLFINTFETKNSHSRGGIAGRAFLGFTFNKYLGIEGGYAAYTSSKYSASLLNILNSSIKFQANTADVVFKGYIPFGTIGLDIYGIAGAARVLEQIKYVDGGIFTNFPSPAPGSTNIYKTRPIYGVGASYDITCNFVVGVEYTQIQKSDSSNTGGTPFINLATLNLSYHLG
jgi:opacity protein-like surface antigen